MKTSLLWLCVLVFAFSCTKEDLSSKSTENPGNTEVTVNEPLILQLVNQVRQTGCTCGTTIMPPVPVVTWNDFLEVAAYNHAYDMYTNNYFSHTGLNGSTAGDRIRATDYNWRAYGENIAKGFRTEESVMQGWLASEGHCKNIMSPNFREMGVSRVDTYWAQEFGAR